MRSAESIVDQLLERDHNKALRKSLFARSIRLFDDGYTPEDIFAVLKKHGELPTDFTDTVSRAWDEFRRRGVS